MNNLTDRIIPVLQQYGVKKASLFGSYARGTQDDNSDVDILIEPPKGMGMTVVKLKRDLENTLNKKVDLVSYNGISRYLKKYILSDQIQILWEKQEIIYGCWCQYCLGRDDH